MKESGYDFETPFVQNISLRKYTSSTNNMLQYAVGKYFRDQRVMNNKDQQHSDSVTSLFWQL